MQLAIPVRWWLDLRERLLRMAGDLKYDNATGNLLYDPATGNLVHTCEAGNCTFCDSAAPATVSVTLGGTIVNGSDGTDPCIGCNTLLATWVLVEAGGCYYFDDIVGLVSCGPTPYTPILELAFESARILGRLALGGQGETAWEKVIAATYDCEATHVLTQIATTFDPCDMINVTYTLN